MKLFKSVDEKLAEIGFVKRDENEYGALYERYDKEYKYMQAVDILHKSSGRHFLQSYDVDARGCSCVGLTAYEMKLFLKKMKQMGLYSGKKVSGLDFRRSDETKSV